MSEIKAITKTLKQIKGQVLIEIYLMVRKVGTLEAEDLKLVDPRSELNEWNLATISIRSIDTNGICKCENFNGQISTYDLDEFSTCELLDLLDLLN